MEPTVQVLFRVYMHTLAILFLEHVQPSQYAGGEYQWMNYSQAIWLFTLFMEKLNILLSILVMATLFMPATGIQVLLKPVFPTAEISIAAEGL